MDSLSSLSEKITSAELAQKNWAKLSMNKRIDFILEFNEIFVKHKSEFVDLLIKDILKPKNVAVDEFERTVEMTRMFCSEARSMRGEVLESGSYPGFKNNKMACVRRQALGTVLCISPFNYPINESLAKIIPALLMGNVVLFKPASLAMEMGKLIEECFKKAGMLEGVFLLIKILSNTIKYYPILTNTNKKENPRDSSLIDFVVSHPLIDAINFTGSTETAEHISAICGIKKLVFGLSGKDASIVLKDADLNLAAREIVNGAFSYSGQRCTGIKKVLVAEEVYDKFIEELKYKIKTSLIAGDLDNDKTNFGPVISLKQAEFLKELLEDAEQMGAKITKFNVKNEKYAENKWGSQYQSPIILEDMTSVMRLAWEEPFGPILPIFRIKNSEEAVDLCNQSSFGLQNSVFTSNLNTAFKIADSLECGVVNINGKDARGPDNFPFLGIKKSGLGVVGGIKYLLLEMSTLKSVVVNMK